jgi:hypothetical protein
MAVGNTQCVTPNSLLMATVAQLRIPPAAMACGPRRIQVSLAAQIQARVSATTVMQVCGQVWIRYGVTSDEE